MSSDRTSSGGYGELLRQSLAAIDSLETEVGRLRQELASRPASDTSEPVAIIGAACRFPGGANDLDSYWKVLENGVDAVALIPPERRALGGWESSGDEHRYAGLLENLDQFDPKFFGISAREAATMDPQQRLVLEVGWEALENAGHAPGGLVGSSTGVFIGLSTSDYAHLIRESGAPSDVYVATGNAHNAVAGRLSFLLGLQGPSMAIDTACSSSLVAMHLACLSLRARNCRMALAGGVNVVLSEQPFECFNAWGMMAPDGKCKTFDASADGFVRSEGCGVVVLKRLADAVADGDNIRAVILGSAVNQDGRSSGLTVPNGPAQEAVIRQALAAAHIEPTDIDYVEAHGTGTSLGDPIEAQALAAVLGVGRRPERPLVVGSVKTNIGHPESAAGVAGVLKVVLSMERERIPAHLHYRQVNPNINWAGAPVEVSAHARDWRRSQRRRIAGISSFGFSGTNAHIIIEEAPLVQAAGAKGDRPLHLLTFSAKTSEALDSTVSHFRTAAENTLAPLGDIAYTTNAGRTHFNERIAVTARDTKELREKLAAGNIIKGAAQQIRGKLAFLFTGQGSQWAGMCKELYETQPVFRDAMDECAGRLRLEKPLLDVIYGRDSALLDQTAYTQPALFSVEWSLAQLWKSWGIEPDVVFGHSVGEYAALCAAGVWTLEDGLRMIAERGRMMQALGRGWGMASVQSSPDKVQDALRGMEAFVSIAGRNAPAGTVISGRLEELTEVQKRLTAAGIKSVKLTVSHGFHSGQMQGVAEEFARFAKQVRMHSPRCRIVSSVTGRFTNLEELRDSSYWQKQVRNAVEFQAGMETLAAAGFELFVEVGPAPVLCGLGRQCIGAEGKLWAPSVRRERGVWEQLLDSVAQLYVRGADVNWSGFDAPYGRRRVVLPTYPFQRQRYWIESSGPKTKAKSATDKVSGEHLATPGGDSAAKAEWFYQIVWREIGFGTPAATTDQWIILAGDADDLANSLVGKMQANGVNPRVVRDRSGSSLRQALSESPGKVIALWGLDERGPGGAEAQFPQASALLNLMQFIAEKQQHRLWVVTSGLEDVESPPLEEAIWRAPIRGLGLSFSAEFPELWGGVVDIDGCASPEDNAAALWRHLQSPGGEDQVAVRKGTRFAARLQAYNPPETGNLALRADGAYLITGGLGGLGLSIARWFASRGARRLILIGRTPLPERAAWRGLSAEHPQAKQVRTILELEAAGVSVHLGFFDVSDQGALRNFLDGYTRDAWPPIQGVLHAAGILEHEFVADLKPEQLARVLRPKLGAWVLDRAFVDKPLDFFIMFSSAASLLRSARLGAYAAANSFLDALAHQRRARGNTAVAINWGVWGETGMASRFAAESVRSLVERGGIGSMSTGQGLDALGRLLTSSMAQVAVLPMDWNRLRRPAENVSAGLLSEIVLPQERMPTPEFDRRTFLAATGEHRIAVVEHYLVDLVSRVLGFPANELGMDQPLTALGLDSLTAVEIRNAVQRDLGVAPPLRTFFDASHLGALARHLEAVAWLQKESSSPAEPSKNREEFVL